LLAMGLGRLSLSIAIKKLMRLLTRHSLVDYIDCYWDDDPLVFSLPKLINDVISLRFTLTPQQCPAVSQKKKNTHTHTHSRRQIAPNLVGISAAAALLFLASSPELELRGGDGSRNPCRSLTGLFLRPDYKSPPRPVSSPRIQSSPRKIYERSKRRRPPPPPQGTRVSDRSSLVPWSLLIE
jgi:hypothetical protein